MIRIVTDSAADFEPEELRAHQIACVPIPVAFGEREYREGVDMTKEQFFELLLRREHVPRTAQPSPYEFKRRLEEAQSAGEGCVAVTLSSALSGEWASASLVRTALGFDNCAVVDSLNATFGERLLVEEAVRLRDAGKSVPEIAGALEALRGRIRFFACVDTMEFLYKGGRVSRTAAAVGAIANIKPLIRVTEEGKVVSCGKALGHGRGLKSLTQRVEQEMPDYTYPVYVVYSSDRTPGEELAASLRAHGVEVSEIRQIGSVIGSHIGPDACGVVYVKQ